MKRVHGGGEEAPRQSGAEGGEPLNDEDNEESAFGSADLPVDHNDPGLRREIRSKYRDLINSVQREWGGQSVESAADCVFKSLMYFPLSPPPGNREDILNQVDNNTLTDVLEEANKLFKHGNL